MNHQGNQLIYWGLALALAVFVVYVVAAFCLKKKPDLFQAISIVFATVGAAGAVRLIGFVFTDQFKLAVASNNDTWWSLTGEDSAFLVIGGIALGWVSCQSIWRGFAELSSQPAFGAAPDSRLP